MSIVPILVVVAAVILVMYFLMTKKSESEDREGIVRDILKKDALSIDFGDGRPVVVKLFGVSPAVEGEMLDDKIFGFLDETLRGQRVHVKPVVVGSADVMSAEIRTMAGEYVNAVMVRQGFARWLVSEASGDGELGDAQQKAKMEQLGIWNPAIIQLLEDRRKGVEEGVSDDDIANMDVDPDDMETKEGST